MTSTEFCSRLNLQVPIIQAPMAGVSTPVMAASVSNAGGLGSLGVGAATVDGARAMIQEAQALTDGFINANVFCHRPARRNDALDAAWLGRLEAEFASFDATPPPSLNEIYETFVGNKDMTAMLLETQPGVVSFHFGLPTPAQISAFKSQGTYLIASATNQAEARLAESAGMDAIVAQGWEAGGHRGCFDENAPDDRHGTFALTRILVREMKLPVIAAGGIMDGAGVRAALSLGAAAAQMGTAFVACDESSANEAYRKALLGEPAQHTVMTRVISGRPARCLQNRFTQWGRDVSDVDVPDYPRTYDAGKALNSAASAKGQGGYGAQWAGRGAPLARSLPTHELMSALKTELAESPV
ncbi:nitronate monooxygenase [Tropicibacter sp. R16_0]|uniref:NAD(P)H-dependent flavin oxidoreductase n=1 Tax=Tropicibacter sp. R16_0 TaxID=2821102 RepID=UPI001ADB1A2C|nr:nitronate monooxygenase [Tropicibacter sp. R16_0]MBO9448953.1 nitronate monooxygenase [Tropicibacter sp. R16_0]